MIAAFKLSVLPPAIYALALLVALVAIFRKGDLALLLFCVLAAFPQLWYPAQAFPGGSLLLSLLVFSAFVGAGLRSFASPDPVPWQWLFWCLLLFSYFGLWLSSFNFNLPLPLSREHPDMAAWKNYAMMLLLYAAAYRNFREEIDLRRLAVLMIALLILTSWRELVGFVSGETFSYAKRANGAFWIVGLNANHFGAFVAELSAFSLALGLAADDKRIRFAGLIAFAMSLFPLAYSYSRGAYLGLVAGLLVIALLRYRALLLVLAILALGWQSVLPESVVDRLQSSETADGELEESASQRLQMWGLARDIASEHPVLGIGFNGFYHASADSPLRNAHNYFLEILADQGAIGLALLLILLGRAAYVGWSLVRLEARGFRSAFGLGLLSMTAVVFVTNLFGDRFSQLELGCYFLVIMGAAQRCLSSGQQGPEV